MKAETTSDIVYVGVKGSVAAIDKKTGANVWQTEIKSRAFAANRFVTLLVEAGFVYAHTYGELFCLNALTGEILWRNKLEGLSYDIASLATEGSSSPSIAALVCQQETQRGSDSAAAGTSAGH